MREAGGKKDPSKSNQIKSKPKIIAKKIFGGFPSTWSVKLSTGEKMLAGNPANPYLLVGSIVLCCLSPRRSVLSGMRHQNTAPGDKEHRTRDPNIPLLPPWSEIKQFYTHRETHSKLDHKNALGRQASSVVATLPIAAAAPSKSAPRMLDAEPGPTPRRFRGERTYEKSTAFLDQPKGGQPSFIIARGIAGPEKDPLSHGCRIHEHRN